MKRTIGTLLCLAILSCNTPSGKKSTENIQMSSPPASEFSLHTDAANGFKMDYPGGWEITKSDPQITFIAVEHDPDTTDQFNESLSLTIMPSEGMTLDAIAAQNVAAAKQYLGDAEIKSAKAVNDNGITFISISLVQQVQGLELVSLTAFFINKGKLYTLNQTTETKKTDTYGPLFQHTINSFNWVSKD